MEKILKKQFIYTLIDPITKEVRYIGKTSNPHDRYKRHLQKCYLDKYDKNTHKSRWIKNLLEISEKPIMNIIDECDDSTVNDLEIYWINEYRKNGYNLTNLSNGGEVGVDWTGRKHTKESIEKISKSKDKYKKPVVEYDLSGNIIGEYESLIKASELTGCHIYLISNCCYKKSYYTVSNRTFRFKGDIFDYVSYNKNIQVNSKSICKYDINGNLITTYDSIRDSALQNDTFKSNISSCCKRKINKKTGKFIVVKGFTYRYFTETNGENL